jgi:hypothetical protein
MKRSNMAKRCESAWGARGAEPLERERSITPPARLVVSVSALLVLASEVFAVASCATNEPAIQSPPSPSTLPDNDAGAALADGGCDASDPACGGNICEGVDWCPVPTGVSAVYALVSVWGAGKDDVWAGGSGGTLIHWNGSQWTPATTGVKNTFNVVWGNGPTDVWAASSTEVVFHFDGAAWAPVPSVPSGNTKAPIFAAWGDGSGAVRFGTSAYDLPDNARANQAVAKRTSDGGVEWTGELGAATAYGVWGSSADDVWLVGDNRRPGPGQAGWTLHGTRAQDGGLAWSETESQSMAVLEGVWGSSADDVWAVGGAGTIRHFDGRLRWESVPSPTVDALNSVWGSGPNDVWAVGDAGTILHWDGATWKSSVAAFAADKKRPNLYSVWGSGPNDVWIVGDSVALRYTGDTK